MPVEIDCPVVAYLEDDCLVSDTMVDIFEELGCRTIVASDGDEMMAQLPLGPVPDLIVSDYYIPGCNGIIMIERIRHAIGVVVPAILLSGWQPTKDVQAHMPANVSLLTKPVRLERLREVLQKLGIAILSNS